MIIVKFDSAADIETFREKMTDSNLSEFKFISDSDDTFGIYKNYTFDSVTYSEKDGVFTATYNLHQYSDIDIVKGVRYDLCLEYLACATSFKILYRTFNR